MLYEIFGGYTQGPICEVVFFDRPAAEAWVRHGNDEVEAELYWIEETALIDDFGVPFARKDLGAVWPERRIGSWS